MEVERMNAEQVENALAEVNGAWQALAMAETADYKGFLANREAALLARQAVVGKPLRGVSLDVAMASDNDNLRQGIQHALAALESGQVDSSRIHEALRRSDEMRAKWEPREVEAVQLAKDLEVARFSATVAHEALRRIVEARDADGHSEDGECAACTAFESAIAAAREIVGGAS